MNPRNCFSNLLPLSPGAARSFCRVAIAQCHPVRPLGEQLQCDNAGASFGDAESARLWQAGEIVEPLCDLTDWQRLWMVLKICIYIYIYLYTLFLIEAMLWTCLATIFLYSKTCVPVIPFDSELSCLDPKWRNIMSCLTAVWYHMGLFKKRGIPLTVGWSSSSQWKLPEIGVSPISDDTIFISFLTTNVGLFYI